MMSRPPTRRTFLSPADALEARTRLSAADYRDVSPEMLRLLSSSSDKPAKRFSPTPSPSYRPSSREFWQVISEEEHELRGGGPVKAGHRRFSSQDVKTPRARTSLLPNPRKHKSTVSEPIFSSSCLPSVLSSSLHSLYEESKEMDPPRLYSHRPASPTSSVTTRSSFESRHKSPLSISSSVDYDSSRTSEDSAYSNNNGKREFLASRSPIPPTPAPAGKRMVTEPIVPMFSRYGAGGEGRQQIQQTTLVIPPKLGKGPPSPTSPRRRAYAPRVLGDGFKKLPEEILLVVLAELKKLHLDIGSLSCTTCWMRDLINLGLSCKKWWRASRIALYEDLQLTGCDSVLHTKKKYKIKYGTRLTLLRRTLRARPDYAEYTKSLKVPAMPETAKSKKEQDEYLDLVASIIMACPNLERLPGFYPTYNHEFSRFVNALSTRTKLVERVWVINPSPFQRQHRFKLSENSQDIIPMLAPGPLMPEQCIDLITYHRNWNNLQTLVVHCNPGGTIDSALFTDIFWSLPTLENLHVSGFPAAAFNDTTLLALPPLKSLRLENLPGITDDGLSSYAAPRRADALTSLTLISIPLVSLQVLSRLFSHLKSLTHFTISQAYPPTLPDAGEIFLHPYLANRNLQYLHWEFANADDDQATEIMAKSIQFHGFPSLKTIRAPTDHEGSLQRLCRPRERIELPADRYRNMALSRRPSPQRSQTVPNMPSPTRSTFSLGHGPNSSISSNNVKSPTRSTFSLNLERSSRTSYDSSYRDKSMSLATARRNAQQRIDVATTQPQFHIIIWDEFGLFVERFAVGGFIGQIQSKISYSLKPDVDASDEAIFGIDALLDGGDEVTPKDGCTGSWNLLAGVYEKPEKGKSSSEKKGKDRWWHTERGRWRDLPLEKLF